MPAENPGPQYPTEAAWLRAVDPSVHGAPLLALPLHAWPAAEEAFAEHQRGMELRVSTTWNFGLVRGRPTAVLNVATLEVPAHLQIALDGTEHRDVLVSAAACGRVALASEEVFESLPQDGERRVESDRRILVVEVRRDELDSFLQAPPAA